MASSSTNPSTSHAISRVTEDQRYQLCLHKLEHPTLTQAELCAWFRTKYNCPVSQPTISQWLKRSDDILARGPMLSKYELTRVRKRRVRHPELETAVYQWVLEEQQKQLHAFQQRQQQNQRQQMYYLPNRRFRLGKTNTESTLTTTPSSSTSSSSSSSSTSTPFKNAISGPALIRQARRIAQEMHIDDIVFCPGWLARFKARYGVQFGKPSMADRMDSNAITVPNTTSDPTSLSSSTAGSPTLHSAGNEMIDIRASIAVPSSIDTSPSLQLHVFGPSGLPSDMPTMPYLHDLRYAPQPQPHHQQQQPQQQPQPQQYLGPNLAHHTPPSTSSTNLDMHMRFLNSIPMVPIIPTYTPPSSSAPKHASADIVIPTSDSPLFSGLMDESEEEDDDNNNNDNDNNNNNNNNKEYGQEDGYRSAPTPAEETFVGVMSLQEAQMAVARLRQFASVQGQGLQGTMHSLDVIEQELGALAGMTNREI